MGQELQIPMSFGNGMSQAFAGQLDASDNLAAGIGQSYGVIGYKGKVWSGRYRGERKNFVRPDDGTPSQYLDVIILGQAPVKSKSYYKKYDINSSEGERPLCASLDGVVPDADVTEKQCDTCALCPKNQWKTDPQTGRKGRECTDYKRLAVLVLPTQTKPTFGMPIMEPMFLRVPPDSLNSLAMMGEAMSQRGYHYATYISRITFDPNKAHPCMVFRPLQPLTDAEAPLIVDLTKDALVTRITVGDGAAPNGQMKQVTQSHQPAVTGLVAAATSGQPTPQQPAQQPQQQVQVQPQQTAPSSIVSVVQPTPASPPSSGLIGETVVPPATPSPNTSASSTVVDTGLGGANTVLVSPGPSLVPTVQSGLTEGAAAQTQPGTAVLDSGAPEESDAELDAKIANFLTAKK